MTVKNISHAAFRGLYDSIKGMVVVFSMDKEVSEKNLKRQSPTRSNSIRQKPSNIGEKPHQKHLKEEEEYTLISRVVRCGLLNGVIFLSSFLIFHYICLGGASGLLILTFGRNSPKANLVWAWAETILSFLFQTVWVIPLFLLSKVVNALWFQDVADFAYKHSRGHPVYSQKLSVILADSVFSMAIQLLFLLQALAVSYVPIQIIGQTLYFIHMCMLYSLYAFEYKWFNMGWETHRRLTFIETNWPYFVGFGLPMAFFTQLSDSWIVSGCVFSILFPFFIVSGNEANPVTMTVDMPFRFFAPVICISNCLFNKTIGGNKRIVNPQIAQQLRS